MALKLVRESCGLENQFQAKVVIEGDNFEEVNSREAKDLALQTASLMGLGPCGIGDFSGPYRFMADGSPAKDVNDFNKLAAEDRLTGGRDVRFRNDYICRQLSRN